MKRITEMFAFIVTDEDGEGVAAITAREDLEVVE